MITTTLNKIRANHPCAYGWTKLLTHLGKTIADDEPVPFSVIVESNGIADALWCMRSAPEYKKEWRLFAVWCARRVQHKMKDPRSLTALDVAERYANGNATDAELEIARRDAYAAYAAAAAAADAYAAYAADVDAAAYAAAAAAADAYAAYAADVDAAAYAADAAAAAADAAAAAADAAYTAYAADVDAAAYAADAAAAADAYAAYAADVDAAAYAAAAAAARAEQTAEFLRIVNS